MRTAFALTALLLCSDAASAHHARRAPAAAVAPAPEPAPLSSPHHIECWNNNGAVTRSYDNDTHGPFYSTAAATIFLDKNDHRMHRLKASNCDETWQPGSSY